MDKFLNSILPVREFKYGEFKVFSIFDFMGKMMLAKIVEKVLQKNLRDSDISVTEIFKDYLIKDIKFRYNQRNSAIVCDENTCFLIVKSSQFSSLIKKIVSILNKKRKNDLPKMVQFSQDGINLHLKQQKYGSTKAPDYDGPLFLGGVWVDHLKALGMPSENAHETVQNAVSELVRILNNNRVK